MDEKIIVGVVGAIGIAAAIVFNPIDEMKADRYQSEAKCVVASVGRDTIIDTKIVEGKDTTLQSRPAYIAGEYAYRPGDYFSGDSIEVTVRNIRKDSMLTIIRLPTDPDTTALLDLSIRFQPSNPPTESEKDTVLSVEEIQPLGK